MIFLHSHFGNINKWLFFVSTIIGLVLFAGSPAQAQICATSSPNWTSVNSGAYNILTNEWNNSATECLSPSTVGFTITSSGISTSTNLNGNPNDPGAYPEIYIGCHWNNCTSTAFSHLPVQVSSITDARSELKTSQPTSGTYDAAYDIWFNQTPSTTGQPNGAELMIWLNSRGNIQPAGNPGTPVTIGGVTYTPYTTGDGDKPDLELHCILPQYDYPLGK
jgi:glycosyl hydrolase family 12